MAWSQKDIDKLPERFRQQLGDKGSRHTPEIKQECATEPRRAKVKDNTVLNMVRKVKGSQPYKSEFLTSFKNKMFNKENSK